MKRQQPGQNGVEGIGVEQEIQRAQKWDEDKQRVDAIPDDRPTPRHGIENCRIARRRKPLVRLRN
jgi:hypothetical protein